MLIGRFCKNAQNIKTAPITTLFRGNQVKLHVNIIFFLFF